MNHYDTNYGGFVQDIYKQIRCAGSDEDLGQNSWLTATEQDSYISLLRLGEGKELLDIGCGAGGPGIRIALKTGCSLTGIDAHPGAIAVATELARRNQCESRAQFRRLDATDRLPFSDGAFDALVCIDAINHLPDRPRIIAEWSRLLKTGGRLVFTDPLVITGPLTSEEISDRTPSGFYLFVPEGLDQKLLGDLGFTLIRQEDTTESMGSVARQRFDARERRLVELREIEGNEQFAKQQRFLLSVHRLGLERRLGRMLFVAEKRV
jgi:SAM-dependent methyltransferase